MNKKQIKQLYDNAEYKVNLSDHELALVMELLEGAEDLQAAQTLLARLHKQFPQFLTAYYHGKIGLQHP